MAVVTICSHFGAQENKVILEPMKMIDRTTPIWAGFPGGSVGKESCNARDTRDIGSIPGWCFWTVVLEKTLESPLDCKEIKPVHPKGKQPWICTGRTDAEAEAPIIWPPDAKSWITGKDLDPGKDWGQEEKGVAEDEIVEWHHWLNGHEFEQTPGDSEGQGSLACCNPWGCEE